jgi:hypothetical protein
LGFRIDNPIGTVFGSLWVNKCLIRGNNQHFWNPGVISNASVSLYRPNSVIFFFFCIVASIVNAQTSQRNTTILIVWYSYWKVGHDYNWSEIPWHDLGDIAFVAFPAIFKYPLDTWHQCCIVWPSGSRRLAQLSTSRLPPAWSSSSCHTGCSGSSSRSGRSLGLLTTKSGTRQPSKTSSTWDLFFFIHYCHHLLDFDVYL